MTPLPMVLLTPGPSRSQMGADFGTAHSSLAALLELGELLCLPVRQEITEARIA